MRPSCLVQYMGHALCCALFLAGCGSDHPRTGDGAGPQLIALDSVRIQENDASTIGETHSLLVSPYDGSFFFADMFGKRVLRFGRDGEFVRVYGRPGGGPGELRRVGDPFLLDAGTLVVPDLHANRMLIFNTEGAEFQRNVPLDGYPSRAVVMDDRVWIGRLADDRASSLALWRPDTDTVAYLGPLPAEYVREQDYSNSFPYIYPAAWADTLMLSFSGRNELVLTDTLGVAFDTVDLPVARRRGVPADMERRSREKDRFVQLSVLAFLHRMPSGDFGIIHGDLTPEAESRGFKADLWASVLSRDRKAACVDRAVPTSGDVRPIPAFRGDTLFVFDRVIEEDELVSWVKMYRVDTRGCRWIRI